MNEYLESDEKGIYAVGDIALYPDRISGGARRVTNYEMAKAQGLVAGANMTGRKRQKFEIVPTCSSSVLGMHLISSATSARPTFWADLDGWREKANFIARYRRGDLLTAAVLCNRKPDEVRRIEEEVKTSMFSRLKK